MIRVRSAVLFIALAAIVALGFICGAIANGAANRQANATKVSYTPIPGGDYKIDPPHSIIGFSIRHMEINWVEGRFKDFNGIIHYNDADVTKSSVEFTAKVESLDTGVEPRNNHLKTADFFDVAKFPEMTFKSTQVERKGKDRYILHGDLTLKGVTKPVALPFTITGAVKDPRGNTRFGIDAQTTIDRRDFGITWGHALTGGGLDVGNEVTINLKLEALQPAPKPAGQQ